MNALLDSIGYAGWGLHALIWLPLVGMAVVLTGSEERAKNTAFLWSLGLFVLSIGLWWAHQPGSAAFQLASSTPWISAWGVNYALGIDGVSLFMVLLTTFTTPLAILGSFKYIDRRPKAFYALMLLLEMGMIGVFLATDLLLFYVFFELTLVPMYFIIGVWGGERRIYAAIKFFLYTALGSLLMLVAILFLAYQAKMQLGAPSFAYGDLLQLDLTLREQLFLFSAFALAFGHQSTDVPAAHLAP